MPFACWKCASSQASRELPPHLTSVTSVSRCQKGENERPTDSDVAGSSVFGDLVATVRMLGTEGSMESTPSDLTAPSASMMLSSLTRSSSSSKLLRRGWSCTGQDDGDSFQHSFRAHASSSSLGSQQSVNTQEMGWKERRRYALAPFSHAKIASPQAEHVDTHYLGRPGRQFTAWRLKKDQAKGGPLIADALTGEERELFEGGLGEALSLKENVVARNMNGVHLGTGVDLKAINWTSQRGVVRPLRLVHQLLRCFHAFIRGILVSTLQGGRL